MVAVSALSSFLFCARKYFLEQVLKVSVPRQEVLVRGGIVHRVFEHLNDNEQFIVQSVKLSDDEKTIINRYQSVVLELLTKEIRNSRGVLDSFHVSPEHFVSKVLPSFECDILFRAKRVFEILKRTNFIGEELWEHITPKVKSEIKISSKVLELNGWIDQIRMYGDELIPVEMKTGSLPKEGVWPGHRLQLSAYAVLLEEVFGTRITRGIVWYVDTGVEREIFFNPAMRDEVLDVARNVRDLRFSLKLPDFVDNRNKCTTCPLRETCYNAEKMNELMASLMKNNLVKK